MKNRKLYDVEIGKGTGVSLPTQLYNILRHEMLKGRWAVGEKLPSYKDLEATTGISRTPIQEAYARLEKDGYVECVRQKGVFVKSIVTKSNASMGCIVYMVDERTIHPGNRITVTTQTFGYWNVPMQEEMIKRGFRLEVIHVLESDHGNDNLIYDKLGDDVNILGIVSMMPKSILQPLLPGKGIPVVYLGTSDMLSTPSMNGNMAMSSYLLTKELMAVGHCRISMILTAGMDSAIVDAVTRGHSQAMKEGDLTVNKDAIKVSSGFEYGSIKEVKDYLTKFSETTAVLSSDVDTSRKVVEVADMLGAKVPKDLSVASMQVGDIREGERTPFLGVEYDYEAIIEACFDVLLDNKSSRNEALSRVVFKPLIEKGISVAKPKG